MTRMLVCGLIVCGCCYVWSPRAVAQDEAMMQKWMEFMTPGPNHKLLAAREGLWTATVRFWMDPSAPPEESEATSEQRMIFGGRYLEDITTGTFGGVEFHGRGLTGYDNGKKRFFATWIDNMGTGIMFGEGVYEAEKKEFHFVMQGTDPMTHETIKSRTVERWISDDEFEIQSFRQGPHGEEFKEMEIRYRRKK